MMLEVARALVFFVVLTLLVSCGDLLLEGVVVERVLGLEQAVVQKVFGVEWIVVQRVLRVDESWSEVQMDAGSIQILQTRLHFGGAWVVGTCQAVMMGEQISECLFTYDLRRGLFGWDIASGGESCGPKGGDGRPITVSSD
jgi:hypothetical protein